jgi:hypothetical protein
MPVPDLVIDTATELSFQETTARETEAAVADLVRFIETSSDDDWHVVTPAEEWSVGVVAHHIAYSFAQAAAWLELVRQGIDIPGSPRIHDQENADHARDFANATREETIELARLSGARAAALVRSLTDEELKRSARSGPTGGSPLTVARVATSFKRHAERHRESIEEALAG